MKYLALLFLLFSTYLNLFSQFLDGQVLNQEGLPIPYVHIYNQNNDLGVLSNEDGVFSIKIESESDSISFSHLSYEPTIIIPKDVALHNKLILKKKFYGMEEVTVIADQSYGIHLLKKCKKKLKRSNFKTTSKAFLSLETTSNDQPTEFLQAFYNAEIKNHILNNLTLKAGRIALAPMDNQYFVSLNTSHALTNLDLLEIHNKIPINPFQVRNLKKRYDLTLLTPKSSPIQHILFYPKSDTSAFFEGEVWIDNSTFSLKKIVLKIDRASRFPFRPINPEDRINNIEFNVSITFDDKQSISLIEFGYQFDYQYYNTTTPSLKIEGQGLLYAFDKTTEFFQPIFEYDDTHNDYRKISFLPYDSTFWSNTSKLPLNDRQLNSLTYFKEKGQVVNFHNDQQIKGLNNKPFFEENNIFWNKEKRWSLSQKKFHINDVELYPSTDIQVQWLIQIDQYGTEKTLDIKSYTVLDIFKSKYYLENYPKHLVYLNLYFDLHECYRQKLMNAIVDTNQMELFYQKHNEFKSLLEAEVRQFKRETDYGNNLEMLQKWNKIITNELQIDNFKYFGLDALVLKNK